MTSSGIEYNDSLERALQGKTRRRRGPPDPNDIRDYQAEMIRGEDRKPEIWRQVMERYGFKWFEPAQLDDKIGMLPTIPSGLRSQGVTVYWSEKHKEGQWRRHTTDPENGIKPMAFTLADLIRGFGQPEKFDEWIQDIQVRERAKHLGIRLPPRKEVHKPRAKGIILQRVR